MARPVVAIVGPRWPDLSIEEEILEPLDPVIRSDPGTDPGALRKTLSGADVALAGPDPRLDASALALISGKGVIRYGVGVDNVDLDAARRLGVWVVVVPDYGTEAVALHSLALILSCLRRLPAADRMVRGGEWNLEPFGDLHLPAGLTAGIVGYGRIGQRVAELLLALGFGRVLATRSRTLPVGIRDVEVMPFEELLSASDIITLHAPASADGRPLLDRDALALMKSGSILINTARGSLVDAAALRVALGEGRPGLAGLDVFEPEPPDLSVFAGVEDRIIFTPHMAWYTQESEYELRRSAAGEALRLLLRQEPLNAVVRSAGFDT
jgi:D-3-phosphoglycerate dehydrogenase